MNNFTIPKERENLRNSQFAKEIEQKRASQRFNQDVRYSELKYNVINFCVTKGMGIAICLLLLSILTNQKEIKDICILYIQTVVTLFVGGLISKSL